MQTSRLTLAFLGPFSAALGNRPITAFRTDKVRALLAYLALEAGQPHNRRALAGLLWPDLSESHSLDNMRVTLYRLRRALDAAQPGLSEQVLTLTRQTVQFNGAAASVDVADFEAMLDTASSHAQHDRYLQTGVLDPLTQAVALYRGELLAGFSLADAPAYEEWLLLRREQLSARALLALKTLADAYEAQGDLDNAHTYTARLLALNPFEEAIYRQLMRILARRGLPDQALAQYATLRRLLRTELGVEPSAQTVDLYEHIRDGKDGRMTKPAPSLPAEWQDDKVPPPPGHSVTPSPPPDLGEIPASGFFVGRAAELSRLAHWLTQDGCRLVAVLGLGGVGKTSLVAHAARAVAGHFERVLWRSLLNAPPLENLLAGFLQTLSEQPLVDPPTTLDQQLALLFDHLRRQRVLLVLDNLESILDLAHAGRFRHGYEAYDQLLRRMATSEHRGTLLITSRERPGSVVQLEGDTPMVHSLALEGLDEPAGQALLSERGVSGSNTAKAALVARYSGNPLALKLVADTVQELFAGDVESFLVQDTLIFDDVRKILNQQFERLTDFERAILFWLAIEREAVDVQTLRRNLVQPPGHIFLESLRGLQNRSLIERHHDGIALQNVVIEYLTDRLVEGACAEIQSERLNLLHSHALLKSQARDDVRQSQVRLILAPVAAQLQAQLGRPALQEKLRQILARLRHDAPHRPSYAGGNLLNLLLHLEIDVTGYDFSHLSVWQADLRGANLAAVNLSGADLTGTTFTEDFGRIFSVAIHPHGHLLAAGGAQSAVRIWSLPNGQNAGLLTGHTNAVMAVAFSPDGALLASGSLDRKIRIWDWRTGQCVRLLVGHRSGVFAVAFSPDGSLLASGSLDRKIRIWDWRTGQCVRLLVGHRSGVFAVAFSPDGTLLASGGQDRSVRLWEVDTGRQLAAIAEHADVIQSLAFHPTDAILAAGGLSHSLYLWDVSPLSLGQSDRETGGSVRLLDTLDGHDHQILSVVFSPDGSLLASSSADTTIQLWKWAERHAVATLRGHTHWVRSLVFSPDGSHLISAGADRTIRLWDVAGQCTLEVLRGHDHVIRAIAMHPDGSLLASGGLDDTIRLWDLRRRQRDPAIRTIRGHVTAIRTLAFSPDGAMLAAGDGKGWVRLWPVERSTPESSMPRTLPGRGMQVNSVAFSPDGRWLASTDDDRAVRIWDLSNLQTLGVLHGHKEAVHAACFAPQGDRLVTAGYEGDIYLWDIEMPAQGRLLNILTGHTLEINDLVLTPDGSHLISGAADRTIRVWETATGRCIQVIEEERGHCKTLALHPHRSLLAAAGWAGLIRLYRLDAQNHLEPLQTIKAHATRISQVAFSPDGARLASVGESGTVRLWDVDSGRQLLRLHGHTQPVGAVAFHPDGQLLASGSDDETVRLWALDSEQPASSAAAVLRAPGPYAGMNITGVTGISEAQQAALIALGAVDAP